MRREITTLALCIASLPGGCATAGPGVPSGEFSRRSDGPRSGPLPGAPGPTAGLGARPFANLPGTYAVLEPPPVPPAPLRQRVAARPAREALWVPGYYAYLGAGRYAWVPGHWEVPPRHQRTFQPPTWEQRGNGYVYFPGGWR